MVCRVPCVWVLTLLVPPAMGSTPLSRSSQHKCGNSSSSSIVGGIGGAARVARGRGSSRPGGAWRLIAGLALSRPARQVQPQTLTRTGGLSRRMRPCVWRQQEHPQHRKAARLAASSSSSRLHRQPALGSFSCTRRPPAGQLHTGRLQPGVEGVEVMGTAVAAVMLTATWTPAGRQPVAA